MTVLPVAPAAQIQDVTFTGGWMPVVYIVAIVVLGFVAVAAFALRGSESKDRPSILTALGAAFWWVPDMFRSIFRGSGPGGAT